MNKFAKKQYFKMSHLTTVEKLTTIEKLQRHREAADSENYASYCNRRVPLKHCVMELDILSSAVWQPIDLALSHCHMDPNIAWMICTGL